MNTFRSLLFGAACALVFHVQPAQSADWFVSGTGSDERAGTSADAAFRTLQKAADVVQPGDTVVIADGIYTNDDTQKDSSVLHTKTSGRADAWITWKAAPGAHPEIQPIGWNGIMDTASYNIFDGLAVTGGNDSIVFAKALQDETISQKDGKPYSGDPHFNTNGIFVTGRLSGSDHKPHHTIIRHCVVSKCPGGGIVGIQTDYLTVEDNLVFDNAWFMRYGGSGITTLDLWAHDDAPGYHVVIQRNQVWNNKTNVPWKTVARLSDGNGILFDVSEPDESSAASPDGATNPDNDAVVVKPGAPAPTPAAAAAAAAAAGKAPRPPWHNRCLAANNLSAFNGGSGIHTFRTRGIDVINNTLYWNGGNVGYPDLFANSSEEINFLNNVIVPRPKGAVTSNNKNRDIRWDYNVYPEKTVLSGPHDIVADPQFIKVARDLHEADFRLRPGSPALDSGTDDLAQPLDVLGQPRPAGKGRDRGAFEQ